MDEYIVKQIYSDGKYAAQQIMGEIVRCKDCRFACDADDTGTAWCNGMLQYTDLEGYCHNGQRKAND